MIWNITHQIKKKAFGQICGQLSMQSNLMSTVLLVLSKLCSLQVSVCAGTFTHTSYVCNVNTHGSFIRIQYLQTNVYGKNYYDVDKFGIIVTLHAICPPSIILINLILQLTCRSYDYYINQSNRIVTSQVPRLLC